MDKVMENITGKYLKYLNESIDPEHLEKLIHHWEKMIAGTKNQIVNLEKKPGTGKKSLGTLKRNLQNYIINLKNLKALKLKTIGKLVKKVV